MVTLYSVGLGSLSTEVVGVVGKDGVQHRVLHYSSPPDVPTEGSAGVQLVERLPLSAATQQLVLDLQQDLDAANPLGPEFQCCFRLGCGAPFCKKRVV